MLSRFGGLAPSSHMAPNMSFNMWSVRSKSSQTQESIATAPRDLFELSEQLERQADIKENIRLAKLDIVEKQSEGRQLALNISRENQELSEHMQVMKDGVVKNDTIDES